MELDGLKIQCENNKDDIKTLFGCVDSIKKKVYYLMGTFGVVAFVFIMVSNMYTSKVNYILGKVDAAQEKNEQILQRLTTVETISKNNERSLAEIVGLLEKAQAMLEKAKAREYYTRDMIKDMQNGK